MLTKQPRSSFFDRNMDILIVLWRLALYSTLLVAKWWYGVVCQVFAD